MKKVFATIVVVMFAFAISVPAFAADVADADEATDSIKRGAQNIDWGWTEVIDNSGKEASKGSNAAEHLVGSFAGGIIGVRKGIHRLGAGAIDLLTFWIPKKGQSLMTPDEPTLK